MVPRGALLMYARVVTGSKIGADLHRAVYRRLISRFKEDLLSAVTACAINLVAQRATLHANCAIAEICDAIRQVVVATDSSGLVASYGVNEGHIERMGLSHFTLRFTHIRHKNFYLKQLANIFSGLLICYTEIEKQ